MITRAYINAVLVGRNRPLLEAGGLDAATIDGTSPLIDDPIADALQVLGLAVADPASPTDSDLEAVPAHLSRAFVHLAEIRLKRTILAALRVRVTQMVGNDQVNLSDMAGGLAREIAEMTRMVPSLDVDSQWVLIAPIDSPTAPEEAPNLPVAWGGID